MALQFKLPGGKLHHMAMLNTPMFGAANPQTFLDLMLALQPDPATGKPDPEKMKAFKASHPDNLAQAEYLASNNPPTSYANSAYWGIHTFKFIDKKKQTTLVRWRFVPQDGEKRLSDDELNTAMAQKGAACEPINFDPLAMADGIAPTNDPVLQFRSPAYAISFAKRLGGM